MTDQSIERKIFDNKVKELGCDVGEFYLELVQVKDAVLADMS
jgi:hypothetical protein